MVVLFLFWLIYFKEGAKFSGDLSWIKSLPLVNASLNGISAFSLLLGLIFIKRNNRTAHIVSMIFAVFTSGLFLISYIMYHQFHGDTKFVSLGGIRYLYFFILISHIIFSIGAVPLIFTTLYHALRKNFIKHKKFARITFPIWMYVSVTGVLVYIFLKYFNNVP